MSKRLRIILSKRDVILIRWALLLSRDNNRNLSYIVRKALDYYVETGKFYDLGHICITRECCVEALENGTKGINIEFISPSVLQWFDKLNNDNLSVSQIVRNILMQSLTPINSVENEWVPDTLDLVSIVGMMSKNIADIPKKETLRQENISHDTDTAAKDISAPKTNESVKKEAPPSADWAEL